MNDDFFLLFGILTFLMIFIYFACVPCGRRNARRRLDARDDPRGRRRRSFTGLFGFRESVRRSNNYTFRSSEPPPTYQWVVEHADAPLVAYVNEFTGHIEYVKWDGTGPVPTRTVLGVRNEGLEVETPAHSDLEEPAAEPAAEEPEVTASGIMGPEMTEPVVGESGVTTRRGMEPGVSDRQTGVPGVPERAEVATQVT